jgi:rhodanese-related sulfurtransferase
MRYMFGRLKNKQTVEEIYVQDAQRRVTDGRAVLIDVRERDEVAAAKVPGALHIPLGQLAHRTQELPPDKELLLFCRSGNRSAVAAELLTRKGMSPVYNVAGGIIAWNRAGLPLE